MYQCYMHRPTPVCPQHCAHPQAHPLSHAGQPLTHPAHDRTGLGKAIQEQLNIACVCNDLTAELLRGARAHTTKFLSVLKPGDLEKARTYTCAHRVDAMHVPCIAGRRPAVAAAAAAHAAGQGSCGALGCAALPPHPSHHTTPAPPASPHRHSWVSPTPTLAPRSSAAACHACPPQPQPSPCVPTATRAAPRCPEASVPPWARAMSLSPPLPPPLRPPLALLALPLVPSPSLAESSRRRERPRKPWAPLPAAPAGRSCRLTYRG